jgi:hypothetical protein
MEGLQASIPAKDANLFANALLDMWQSNTSNQEEDETGQKRLTEVKDFLSKTVTALNAKIASEGKKTVNFNEGQMGEIVCEFPDLQMLEPRGRFKVSLTGRCLLIDGKSGGGMIEYDKIKYMILMPSHTTSKKEGEDYFALVFHSAIKICGKDMKSVLFNLSKTLPKVKTEEEKMDLPATESENVTRQFQRVTGQRIQKPDPRLFRTVSNQKSFLRCHRGTQEGAIYPLECGIVFVKPLLCLGADEIASITAGRGGGSGNTRFVDLKVSFITE